MTRSDFFKEVQEIMQNTSTVCFYCPKEKAFIKNDNNKQEDWINIPRLSQKSYIHLITKFLELDPTNNIEKETRKIKKEAAPLEAFMEYIKDKWNLQKEWDAFLKQQLEFLTWDWIQYYNLQDSIPEESSFINSNNIEIERKFRLSILPEEIKQSPHKFIAQGYLTTDPDRTIRVRIKEKQAFLTIKGRTHGMARKEFEYEIPVVEAEELLELCTTEVIRKTRYVLKKDNIIWEVDLFHNENEGLILAEVELNNPNQRVTLPDWPMYEVTGDPRYYNSFLSEKSFKQWSFLPLKAL